MFIDVYSVNHAQSAGLFCEGHNQADLRFIDGDLRRLMAGSQNVKRSGFSSHGADWLCWM